MMSLVVALVVISCTQIDVERAVSLDGSGNFVAGDKILNEVLKREGNAVTHQRANALLELALNREKTGRILDAEALIQQAILIQEEAGDDPYMKAWGVRYLAGLMVILQRYDEAEALYRRALTLNEQGMGYWRRLVSGERPANYDIHWSRLGLANVLIRLQRYEEAAAILEHEIDENEDQPSFISNDGASLFGITNLGIFRNDELYVQSLISFGDLYLQEGKRDQALAVFRKAAEISKERLPATSVEARVALEVLFDFDSKTSGREKIPDDLVRSAETSSGSGGPYGMGDAYRRAEALLKENKLDEALDAVRKATAIFKSSYPMLDSASTNIVNLLAQTNRRNIGLHLAILGYHYPVAPQESKSNLEESFEVAQLLDGAVGQTIAKMAARSTGTASDRIRKRQDLIDEIRHKQHVLTQLIATGGNLRAMIVAQQELATTKSRFTELDEELERDPAAYRIITEFPIVSSSEVRELLKHDESLVKYYIYNDIMIIWGISGNQDKLCRVIKAIDEKGINSMISKIRDNVDPEQNHTLTAFPAGDAFSLWRLLFSEIETCLGQTHTFYIVPDGIIGNLPFSILVTKKPVSDDPDYKHVAWFSRQFATVYLQSVNSLRALRRVDHFIDEPRAFVGVGDPVLRGSTGMPRGSRIEAASPKGQLDIEGLRSLQALPEAASELKAMAHALQADERSSLFLEQRASKTVLVHAPELGKARIIAFATHGLMSGDFGLQEPALVLTPQLPEDDGLLKVSDILDLHLNADWVVLSACNTAAGDAGAYNGISSLASAFFYAGSRSLLVCLWPVFSQASVAITTGAFGELRKSPGIGRAEALRRSMMALLDHPGRPEFAHPAAWAPFILMGEGSRGFQRQSAIP